MSKKILIEKFTVGGDEIFLIAEIGGNFTKYEEAVKMVDLAKKVGVHCVKLQNYRADTIASKEAYFEMENTGRISQYELFKKYEISKDLTKAVFNYARSRGLTVFSTPSHSSDVDFLEELGVGAYKIGSDDAVNTPFLKYIARLRKPIILSTGMCTLTEVKQAVNDILEEGNDQIILLHCTTNYPCHVENVNLGAMITMRNEFTFPIGYSDHTLGIDTCYAAAVLGAKVLEFHFTYDRDAEGPDHMLSKDVNEASELVKKVNNIRLMMGDGIKQPLESEMSTRRNNRKSLVITDDVKKGETLSNCNVEIKRPGYGIGCRDYYNVLGKKFNKDLNRDHVLKWSDIA